MTELDPEIAVCTNLEKYLTMSAPFRTFHPSLLQFSTHTSLERSAFRLAHVAVSALSLLPALAPVGCCHRLGGGTHGGAAAARLGDPGCVPGPGLVSQLTSRLLGHLRVNQQLRAFSVSASQTQKYFLNM